MAKNESKLEKRLPHGRPRVVHGGFSFLVSGRLPEHRAHLLRYLSASRNGLIEDLGGEENLSTQELILVDRCVNLLGILRCVEEFCKEKGVFVNGNLQPSLGKHYISYTNSLKQILALLGLKNHDAGKLTPLELAQKIDKEGAEANAEA